MIGLALLVAADAPRAYPLVLAGAGLFYGLFGVVRLGVVIDVVLIFASAALGAVALLDRRASRALGAGAA